MVDGGKFGRVLWGVYVGFIEFAKRAWFGGCVCGAVILRELPWRGRSAQLLCVPVSAHCHSSSSRWAALEWSRGVVESDFASARLRLGRGRGSNPRSADYRSAAFPAMLPRHLRVARDGGECRIQTCGVFLGPPVFKTGAIGLSANSPFAEEEPLFSQDG